ncbi:MAG: 1-acyl-sn-glycerol-3-phosphate acyltransferase [Chloroflexi bacterium]|nr:1-acyl-sn-glycerol-3-phosphate acyltransferase [Chloroflexota bacterium]MCL5275853.1 1-acyl-sn-glycerol-3-phosphate acyltransferase [Chloroflexota bacterium]
MITQTAGKKSAFSQRWKWNKRAHLRWLWNAGLRFAYRALMRVQVNGLEHVPPSGPVIVMINHVNFFDPVVVLAALGRPITPMAKVEAFEDWRIRPLVVTYGAIPVHRGAVDTQAIRSATEVLASGGMILISPEGTRSSTGGLIQGQEGLAYLATRTNATILPVGIVGTPQIWPMLKRFRRAPVTFTIGAGFVMQTDGKPTRETLRRLTDDAMYRLAAVLPEAMRGVYL